MELGMEDYTVSPPTDDQVDQLILDYAVSGRLSHNDLDTMVTYIHAMREKVSRYEQCIIPKDETGKWH